MSTLGLQSVTKRYGGVTALEACTLEIDDAGFHCLLGPNGSGKTTLMRLLLGLERPTEGAVRRVGVTVGGGFQQPSFYPSLSVRENLAVFGRAHGGADEDWRERLLEGVGLGPVLDRLAGELSGGFARKLDLALALQRRPDVVLLDEPLGALDDVSRERLLAFLSSYAASDRTVVVSTHRISSFAPHLDRLTVLHDGSVILDRERAELDLDGPESLQDRYVDMVLDREGVGADD